jgi:transcriptional regulator with XRE-family HTH domain
MPNRFEGYISNFTRQRRLQLGLTQKDVAQILGVTADYISLLESGERRLDLDRIPRLADALDAERFDLCASALRDRCPQLFAEIFSSVESVAVPPESPQTATQGGAA